MLQRSTLAILALLYGAAPAHGLDIPMARALAETALDSKTCFGTLTSNGELVGFEMTDSLLASSGGKLVALPARTAADIGDKRPRAYEGEGIHVAVAPQRTARRDEGPDVYTIRERATLAITERGKRRTLPAEVLLSCSP